MSRRLFWIACASAATSLCAVKRRRSQVTSAANFGAGRGGTLGSQMAIIRANRMTTARRSDTLERGGDTSEIDANSKSDLDSRRG